MNQKFKILFLSNIPTPYQLDFIEEVNKNSNYEMRAYFLWEKEKNRDWLLKTNPKFIYADNFSYRPRYYLNFYKFFKDFKPKFILIGGYKLPLSNLAIFLAKISGCKIIFWLENPTPYQNIKKIIRDLHLKFKLLFVDCILAIGKRAASNYQKFSNCVYNLPYSMKFNNYYGIERKTINDNVKFLFSGQLIERKNITVLIEAFKQIKNKNIKLTVVGSGELGDEIEKIIKNDKRIKLLGFIQPQDLYRIFSKSDVFVLPSRYDGWAVVVAEAMAAGMPIVSTEETGAVFEFIKHEENGYLYDINKESIKDGLMFYINNPRLVYKHGCKNRKIIKNSAVDAKNMALYLYNILSNLK